MEKEPAADVLHPRRHNYRLTDCVSFLRWLSYGETVGIPVGTPMSLDLGVVQIAFALQMGINIAQIITIILSLFLYKALSKKL